ncbi:MAG: YihY/virulence factor BrkB family protein [Myxococcota bacterium]
MSPLSDWRVLVQLVRRTVDEFMDDDGPLIAAGLSFYAILSLAPLLMLILLLAGPLLGEASVRSGVVTQVRTFAGPGAARAVGDVLSRLREPQLDSASAIIGVAVLLFGATRVFAHLQRALNKVWDVRVVTRGKLARGVWKVVRKRLLSAAMILAAVFMLLLSLLASTALAFVGQALPGSTWGGGLYRALELAASFLLAAGLFGGVFKFLPDARVAYRDVAVGAAVTAALFVLGKFGIALYLGHRSTGSAFGAAGSLILLLLWVYYSCSIFLLGAEFTEVHAKVLGSGIHPESYAVRVWRQHLQPGEEGHGG